jgi:hypothetical protein
MANHPGVVTAKPDVAIPHTCNIVIAYPVTVISDPTPVKTDSITTPKVRTPIHHPNKTHTIFQKIRIHPVSQRQKKPHIYCKDIPRKVNLPRKSKIGPSAGS